MDYLHGYPGDLFDPDGDMTRAEAAQMFYNLLLDKDVAITASFTDVGTGAWYSQAVNTLASLGILGGVGEGRFSPERSITRAEFTAIAMRFAQLERGGESPFSDVHEGDWFYDVVVGAVRYGWIGGYPEGRSGTAGSAATRTAPSGPTTPSAGPRRRPSPTGCWAAVRMRTMWTARPTACGSSPTWSAPTGPTTTLWRPPMGTPTIRAAAWRTGLAWTES